MMRGQLSVGFILEVAIAMALLASTVVMLWHLHAGAERAFAALSKEYSNSIGYFNSSRGAYGSYGIFER